MASLMAMASKSLNRLKVVLLMSVIVGAMGGCGKGPVPPVAEIKPHEMTLHGDTRVDNYYWLNERENPDVIAYLEAENAYLDEVMKDTVERQQELLAEMKARIKKDDSSAPVAKDGYLYYSRYVMGGEYAVHCRRQGNMQAAEEVMLDGNVMGQGEGYFALRGVNVSPDTKQLVYAVDKAGRRIYTLHFKDLATGEISSEEIPQATGNVAWANDNRTVFYTKQDPETLRSHQIWRHTLGTDASADVLV